MKKHIWLMASVGLFMTVQTLAQHSKVTSAWSYLQTKDYDKAVEAINLAAQNDDTKGEAKTWFYRGEAYDGLYTSTVKSLKDKTKGKDEAAIKAYNDYVSTNIDLKEAANSYIKTIELDSKKDFPEAKDLLVNDALTLYNDAYTSYNNKKYAESLDKFKQFMLSYNALGDAKAKIDKAFSSVKPPIDIREIKLYMAGCALQLKDRDQAKQLLQELADSKYPNPVIYLNLTKMYERDNDTAKALTVLDKGLDALPDSLKSGVLVEKLNIYLSQGKSSDAITVAESAIKQNPKNISLYVALANLYAHQKQYDKATEIFKQASAINNDNFALASSEGLLKYNLGVDKFNLSIDAKAAADQDKYLAQAREFWKDAIKDLEHALTLQRTSTDQQNLKDAYDALSKMYYHLDDPTNGKKYNELFKQQ